MGVAVSNPAAWMPSWTSGGTSSSVNRIPSGRLGLPAAEDARADDAGLVEETERPGHQELVEGVGRRGEDRGDDEVDQDRVLPVLRQELGRHQADPRPEREGERQLEHQAEGE